MRTQFLLVFLFFQLFSTFADGHTKLSDAVKNNLVSIKLRGNDLSTHYIKPIILEIHNNTPRPLELQLESGLTLNSIDSSYQDFMIVKEELMALNANEEKEFPLYAMCIQKNNSSPENTTLYQLGDMAEENLLAVAAVVNKNKYFNTLGQYAVWAISDNSPVQNIAGFDTVASKVLQQLVCDITGKPLPVFVPGDYTMDYYEPVMSMTIYGSFGFTVPEPTDVTVAMFNTHGIVVRELFNKKEIQPGDYEYEYSFDGTVYTDDLYYLKMIMNNEVVSNMEMRMFDE